MSAERFLAAFNRVEMRLRELTGEPPVTPFARLVRLAEAIPVHVVQRHADELLDFAEVRNAIVHRRGTSHDIIADPRTWAVERIEHIADELTRPKPVLPTFQRRVTVVAADAAVADALSLMGQGDFSQLPVYAGGDCRGLLTERAIARWLITAAPGDLVSLFETRVEDVMAHNESTGNLMFIGRDATVPEIASHFRRAFERGRPLLEAILITESGKESEKPLGIVTAWDVLNL